MGLFQTALENEEKRKKEQEEIRGLSDAGLKHITTEQLICVGLARLMESQGCEDDGLIDELYIRGGSNPK